MSHIPLVLGTTHYILMPSSVLSTWGLCEITWVRFHSPLSSSLGVEDVRPDIHSPAQFHIRGPTNGPIISWGPLVPMTTVPSVGSSRQWARPVSGLVPSVGSSRQWARPVSGLVPSVGLSCQWARPVSGLVPSVGSPCQWALPVSGLALSVGLPSSPYEWAGRPRQWAGPISGLAPSVGSPRQWARLVSGRFRSPICSRPGLARDAGQASHYGRGVSLVKSQTFPLLVRSYGGSVWLVRLAPHEG